MAKPSKAVEATLTEIHNRYCDCNQTEASDHLAMERGNHPYARQYRAFRDFFDSLKFAANARARHFSYKDPCNLSEYWAPELSLTSRPSGPEFEAFPHIYRAHEDWAAYVETAAKAGWPKGCVPSINEGSWSIHTTSDELVDAVIKLCQSDRKVAKPGVRCELYHGEKYTILEVRGENAMTLTFHRKLIALLRQHHKGFVLPKRSAADNESDTASKPLKDKTLLLGNVKQVTVTDRHVLVPLVPAGDVEAVEKVAGAILPLLDQGLPFAQAQAWLSKFMKPSALRKLEAQYA